MTVKDLKGLRFGLLSVVERDLSVKSRKAHWVCKCDCGNYKTIRGDSIQKATRSCGCLRDKQAVINVQKNHKHKESHTRLHDIWLGMKQRCTNPNSESYPHYGGRGIKIYDEWSSDYVAFSEWAKKNGYEDHLTIERKDVNGDYEPANCTWITREEQADNRTTAVLIEHSGETLSIKQWANKLSLKYGTLHSRYRRGEEAPHMFRKVR